MKKWLFSLLLILFVIIGCSDNSIEQPVNSNEKQIESTNTTEQKSETNKNTEDNKTNVSDTVDTKTKEVSEYQTFEATVVSVADGDTFTISFNNKEEKIRLLLVDTLETKHPKLGIQPLGKEASNFTNNLLKPGTKVLVEKDVSERDKYGRFLAYVYVNGKMVNELLLEKGLARVAYVYSPNTRYVDEFREIQDNARQQRVGIWSIEDYVHSDGFHSDSNNRSDSTTKDSKNSSSYVNNTNDDTEQNVSCKGKIKGNANSKVYHVPGGSYYDSTEDNIVWFCSEKEAQDSGYRKSKR